MTTQDNYLLCQFINRAIAQRAERKGYKNVGAAIYGYAMHDIAEENASLWMCENGGYAARQLFIDGKIKKVQYDL